MKVKTIMSMMIVALILGITTQQGFAVSESDSLFTAAGAEITALTATVKVLLGLALAPILLFLGWKYFKRAKSAA
jgi:hypothetical protein